MTRQEFLIEKCYMLLFGADGFEKIVDEVAGLEKKFGIENLAQFTPAL